jgi:hypothetical protein
LCSRGGARAGDLAGRPNPAIGGHLKSGQPANGVTRCREPRQGHSLETPLAGSLSEIWPKPFAGVILLSYIRGASWCCSIIARGVPVNGDLHGNTAQDSATASLGRSRFQADIVPGAGAVPAGIDSHHDVGSSSKPHYDWSRILRRSQRYILSRHARIG